MKIPLKAPGIAFTLVATLLGGHDARAASATWNGGSANWTASNWTSSVPGATSWTSGASSSDTATINTGSGTITVDATRNIKFINFDTNAGAYTLGSGSILLTYGGGISILGTYTGSSTETISSPVLLEPFSSSSTTNTASFNNSSSGGVLSIGSVSGAGSGYTTSVLTLAGTNTGANAVTGAITNGGFTGISITKLGAGSWSLSGTGTSLGSGNINASQGTLTVSGGSISTNGQVIVGGSSGLTGTLSVTGGTLASSSYMQVGSGGGSGGTGLYTQSGGTVTIGGVMFVGFTTTAGLNQFDLSGGSFSLTGALTSGYNATETSEVTVNGTGTFSSAGITVANGGTGTFTVAGSGSVTTTGALKLSGGAGVGTLNLNGGTLTVNSNSIAAASGTGNVFNFNGGTLAFSAAATVSSSANQTFQVQSGGAIFNTSGHAVTISQALLTNASPDGGVTLNDTAGTPGTLTLFAQNSYNGPTAVVAGTLTAGVAQSGTTGAFGTNSAVTVSSGATLNLNGNAETIGSLTGAGNVTLGAATITVGTDNTSPAAYSGVMTSSGSPTTSLIKVGTGKLTLSGANTYTGATTIENGTLAAGSNAPVSSAGAVGTAASAIALGDATSISSNFSPTLLISTGGGTVARAITVGSSSTSTSGVYTIGGSNASGSTATYSGAITLNQAVTLMAAAGATTNFNSSGTWVTNNNPFTIGSSGNTGMVKIDDLISSTTSATTIAVTNGSALNLTNTGNTFLGAVSVKSGSVNFGTGNSTATGAQSLGENTSLTLGLAGGTPTSGSLNYTGASTAGSSAATLAKNITVAVGTTGTISNTGGSTLTLAGTLTKANSVLVLTGGIFDVTGQITGGNTSTFNSDLVVNGAATVTLDGSSNNYTGPTYVYGGSTLKDGLGTLPSGTVLNLGNSGDGAVTNTFDLTGHNQSIAALDSIGNGGNTNVNKVTNSASGTGTATLTLTGLNNDIPAVAESSTFGGTIADGATAHTALAVSGGIHTLTAANTYTGGTTVSGGTLYVNGGSAGTSSGTGAGGVAVMTGGNLAGGGTIKPAGGAGVTIANGATLSSGTVQTLNATVNGGSGSVNGTGTGGGLTLDNTEASGSLLSVSGGATLTFALGSTTSYSGGSGSLNFASPNTNSTYLKLTGSTVDQVFATTTTALNINLIDLTVGSTAYALTLRSQNPYLLIQTGLSTNDDFANLWTSGGQGQNGYVLGVSDGTLTGYTAFNINAYDINGLQINTSSNLQNLRLYLYNGQLEVVPEPGTWALIIVGFGALVFYQRRRHDP